MAAASLAVAALAEVEAEAEVRRAGEAVQKEERRGRASAK
jgi:hypothetical protein